MKSLSFKLIHMLSSTRLFDTGVDSSFCLRGVAAGHPNGRRRGAGGEPGPLVAHRDHGRAGTAHRQHPVHIMQMPLSKLWDSWSLGLYVVAVAC
ncbi:hypothetical protein CEG14_23345 [Bordetella genomosp. 1]|uniref:Uncharacterized protein n=1 Tax=Bordetella genomosp. 1 TaxID=1395607 RepID=A0A261RUW6_9BORD|nr:hypothetical protein [Bordetella genomosp. 1]OZI28869.1 hypothetical protein CEG14_23345 [Bordetella genomosp. 1]